jgi:hypothetical protein
MGDVPADALKAQFGPEVARWQRWAQGLDDSTVRPCQANRSETAAYYFDDPLTSWEQLTHLLDEAARTLAAQLHTAALQAQEVGLVWQTADGQRQQRRQLLCQPVAAADTLGEALKQLGQPSESSANSSSALPPGIQPAASSRPLSLKRPTLYQSDVFSAAYDATLA